jgi:hypothetical protein
MTRRAFASPYEALSMVCKTVSMVALTALLAASLAGCYGTPTPPQTTANAAIAANSAAWKYDYPGSLVHSVRGEIFLNVAVTVTNHGSVPIAVLAAEFSIYWQNESVGIPAIATTLSTSTIANGASASTTVAFLSTELRAATKIEFRQVGFINTVSANVPAPAPLPLEVMFTGVTSAWSQNGTNNRTASSGHVFLWVNFSVMNHLTDAVGLSDVYFKVVDANGTVVNADGIVGPTTVGGGGMVSASVSFEVPDGFAPKTLRFDAVLGPWTDVAVPVPT